MPSACLSLLPGAITLAFGLVIWRTQALRVGVECMAEDSDEMNIGLSHVRDRLREPKYALVGVILLTIGFCCKSLGVGRVRKIFQAKLATSGKIIPVRILANDICFEIFIINNNKGNFHYGRINQMMSQ